MDWTPGGMSSDVEDRRGSSGGGFGFGGGGLGIVGIIFLLIISLITGRNYIGSYLSGGGAATTTNNGPVTASPAEDRSAHLVSFVLDDVQSTWDKLLPEQTGQQYRHAHLVLFRDYTQSEGCGVAQSQTGPFYCPGDEKVYIDLGFWDELRRLGGSTADFAQAYVIAHELGHHVQNILGIERQMRAFASRNPEAKNELSVMLELQADCLAGVWGHNAAQRGIVHREDVEEGLKAAAAVGDDHIQKMSRSAVSPETFTHGSSAQRQEWFMRGFQSGDVNQCKTFENFRGGSF